MKNKNSILIPMLVVLPVLFVVMNARQVMAMQAKGEGSSPKVIDSDEIQVENRQQLQINQSGNGEMVQQRIEIREEVKTQLQTKLQNKEQVRDLAVGHSKAMLKGGAEFSYDKETEEVTVVTPSGQEQVLVNLPDVAIEKMAESGLLDTQSSDEIELDVELQGDDIIYSKRDFVSKKLFGIFPREIDSEVMMNDSTGEVTETISSTGSFFQRFLDRLSF